jgi:superfamily II DNA or RNA helicase
MEVITVQKINEVNLKVKCEAGIGYELQEFFSFMVPGYQFTPLYKMKVWDGSIKIYNALKSTLPIGLYFHLIDFCRKRDYELKIEDSDYGLPNDKNDITKEEIISFILSLNITSKNKPLVPNDHQIEAIYKAIKYKRKTIVSPTGSGKSYVIYCIFRWLLTQNINTLIIVPSTALVEQMKSDFGDYSSNNDFDVDAHIFKLYAGQDRSDKKPVGISTWQTATKLPKEWFARFGSVFVDEVHMAKSKELTSILERCTESSYRFGATGSLDKSLTHHMMIQAMLGTIIKVVSTRELIDKGILSDIQINCIHLNYSNEIKKSLKTASYQQEIDFLISHERRNKVIRKLALSLKGNTLILYAYVDKHGQVLYDMISEKAEENRPVHFIHGDIKVNIRETMRHDVEDVSVTNVYLSFGDQELCFKDNEDIILSSGKIKKASEVTIDDDIDTEFLINKGEMGRPRLERKYAKTKK